MASFESELRDYLTNFAKAYTEYAAEELTKTAREAIQYFYDDYKKPPRKYIRTDDLLNNSYEKYKKNNGNYYYGGVRIGADCPTHPMQPYYHGKGHTTDPTLVFNAAYFEGKHGFQQNPPKITSPTPFEIIKKKRDSEEFQQEVFNHAMQEAKKKKYTHLHYK